uniref:Uncharacterized protein n=1 Tax=viral metagenome TaxID=1070528 RepID=A0A6C0BSB3_9ZZZZ
MKSKSNKKPTKKTQKPTKKTQKPPKKPKTNNTHFGGAIIPQAIALPFHIASLVNSGLFKMISKIPSPI